MNHPPPIFITGLPRSGTTWSSHVIAATIKGRIIHEPFNWRRFPERETYHMRYMSAEKYDNEFANILRKTMLPRLPVPPFNRQPVIKDVHTCLALESITAIIKPLIVVIMRHPCAIAASWQTLNLEAHTRLKLLLSQPQLVDSFLRPFLDHVNASHDFYSAIGTYWGAAYYIMHLMYSEHPEWFWITHETLCNEPVFYFEKLFNHLNIDLTLSRKRRLENFLIQHDKQGSNRDGIFAIKRITDQEPYKWLNMLSHVQIDSVLSGARPFKLLEQFFPEYS